MGRRVHKVLLAVGLLWGLAGWRAAMDRCRIGVGGRWSARAVVVGFFGGPALASLGYFGLAGGWEAGEEAED